MQYIPYIVYGIAIVIFLVISALAIYHVQRFRVEWDRTRVLTFIYVIYSVAILVFSAYLMMHTVWSELL